MYFTKEECFTDTLVSLRFGVISEDDFRILLQYYRDMEFYECCAGLVKAYAQFKKEEKNYVRSNKEDSRD